LRFLKTQARAFFLMAAARQNFFVRSAAAARLKKILHGPGRALFSFEGRPRRKIFLIKALF
jgi:hypothetical protein